ILVRLELVAWWVKHHSLRLHVLFNRKKKNNNNHITRNSLQINLHLIILLSQFFYSYSYLIGVVLASSDFSIFKSFQSSLTVRKNPDFSYPYVRFFIDKIYYFFDSKYFCIKNFIFLT